MMLDECITGGLLDLGRKKRNDRECAYKASIRTALLAGGFAGT
jgi:hypothetical protein